jgi:hypothetical protein
MQNKGNLYNNGGRESATLNSFGKTKQEIESKKDLPKIFCCLAFRFFLLCGQKKQEKARNERKTETANKFPNPPNVMLEC